MQAFWSISNVRKNRVVNNVNSLVVNKYRYGTYVKNYEKKSRKYNFQIRRTHLPKENLRRKLLLKH